ncbi:hypothetical protein [Streptosporangium sp. NPDC000396]|uniref:hypothetical protein n=1 Tax=Streptosporangium sp. NPDC000396 TaxID=3366185 RepID=UPI00368F3F32
MPHTVEIGSDRTGSSAVVAARLRQVLDTTRWRERCASADPVNRSPYFHSTLWPSGRRDQLPGADPSIANALAVNMPKLPCRSAGQRYFR